MIQKSDVQRPRMLANVRRLPERREAHASHSWGDPEAKLESGANVRSGAAVTFDVGREQRDRAGRGMV